MPRWMQYTLAGLGATFALALVVNQYQVINSSDDSIQESIDNVQRSLDALEEANRKAEEAK